MATLLTLYQKNDQYIVLPKLRDGLTGQYKSDATVTATLYDKAGVEVENATNIALMLVPDSVDGTYRGRVSSSFNPVKGKYKLRITASESGDTFYAEYDVSVVARTS